MEELLLPNRRSSNCGSSSHRSQLHAGWKGAAVRHPHSAHGVVHHGSGLRSALRWRDEGVNDLGVLPAMFVCCVFKHVRLLGLKSLLHADYQFGLPALRMLPNFVNHNATARLGLCRQGARQGLAL